MLTVYQALCVIPSTAWDLLEAEMSALISQDLKLSSQQSCEIQDGVATK